MQRPGLRYLGVVRSLGSPGHRRAPRLVWVEHEELAQYGRCGDLAQGSESSWGKAWSQLGWEMGSDLGPEVRP